jgi:hypothetical protein
MRPLTDSEIARACPACPDCKQPLIARPDHRRFIENQMYVQCINNHLWLLSSQGTVPPESTSGGEGG